MKKMKTNKAKIKRCKFPNCNKETHNERSLFCLEHERSLRGKSKEAMTAATGVAMLAIAFVARKK